jgi:solute carrier family 13 (sodium-dependent dicarboxylate transporter), member 2/3/5
MVRRLPHSRSAIPWIIGALLIYLCALALPPPAGLGHEGQAVLGVVFAGVLLWISEALPLGLTALLVLVLLGIVPTWKQSATFVGFSSPVVFFLIGAAAIGTAVEATGLAERIARVLVRSARGSPNRLYVQMLASLPGLALVMPSAITRNAVLIPAYRDTLHAMGISRSGRTGRALMLALGILNPLASSAILTGGITSITASAIIGNFSWLRWFALMAVPYYLLICLGGIALRVITGKFEERIAVQTTPAPAAPFSRREIKTLVILLIVSLLWLTDFIHGLSPAIPALLGAVLLVCPRIGVLGWKDFESRLSWGLVLTVGASLSLAQAMISAGTVDWLGQQFILVFTGETQKPLLVLTSIIVAVALVHIAITNLAACAALIIPIVMTIAHTAGLNPLICALIVTIVIDSVIFYPVQTASNLLAYESGYFGAMDVGRLGLMMLGLTILVGLCVAVPYWSLLGLPLMAH